MAQAKTKRKGRPKKAEAVVKTDPPKPREFIFVSPHPGLRLSLPGKRYRFRDGRLVVKNEADAEAIKRLPSFNRWFFEFVGDK